MAELSEGFTCTNADCKIVYAVDPGDCACGATTFIRVGEQPVVTTPIAPTAPHVVLTERHCVRPDCRQLLPETAAECLYCGTPVTLTSPSPDPLGPDAALVAADGTRIILHEDSEVILGRNPDESPWARLMEGHPGVSRRHAAITASRGRLFVRDLESSNGTWVNNIRINGAAEIALSAGITVGLGRRFELVVSIT